MGCCHWGPDEPHQYTCNASRSTGAQNLEVDTYALDTWIALVICEGLGALQSYISMFHLAPLHEVTGFDEDGLSLCVSDHKCVFVMR